MNDETTLTPVEGIKTRSNYLRGTIVESLADDATGAHLPKTIRNSPSFMVFTSRTTAIFVPSARDRKLEPAHSFMIRVRVPGGIATAEQWLEMDRLARKSTPTTRYD